MQKLSRIQKSNNLNDVFSIDHENAISAAHYNYMITAAEETNKILTNIAFQNGPRAEEDSVHGVLDTDLLEIVRDRLIGFQRGAYACRENAIALTHIEEALLWMNKRVDDRSERNVLGTREK